jgi:hypothetical protein
MMAMGAHSTAAITYLLVEAKANIVEFHFLVLGVVELEHNGSGE